MSPRAAAPPMSRRRPSLPAYVRRRWRAVGAVVVLLLGSFLVLAITDRGHDPAWRAGGPAFDQVDVSPDGSAVYTLLREEGRVSRLEARRGDDGALLWESPMNATRAVMRASAEGAIVATDFPLAFLTYYDADGGIRSQVPLEGNPRAIAVDGPRFALALQAPSNPILLFDEGRLVRTLRMPSFVNSLDYHAGRVAAGTGAGVVTVFGPDASILFNASYPVGIRSVRLAEDGSALVAGGSSLSPGDLSGLVAFVDLVSTPPARWSHPTPTGVGLVGIDATGLRVLAVEDAPPRATLTVLEGATGALAWTRTLEGNVARDDAGAFGGAALSPDGRHVAASTLRGELRLLDGATGETRWTYRGAGATTLAFASENPDALVANGRILQTRPYDTLFAFSMDEEPAIQRAPLLATAFAAAAALALALVIGVGFWRVRRSY